MPADRAAIQAEMDAVEHHRETRPADPREDRRLDLHQSRPGSKAWQLVDAAGCRGLRVGGAMVSEMHCNFLINVDNATAHDLELPRRDGPGTGAGTSGVRLDWEIRRIGRFADGRDVEPFLGKAEA